MLESVCNSLFTLPKAIMVKMKLKNTSPSPPQKKESGKIKGATCYYCVSLLRKSKNDYYNSINRIQKKNTKYKMKYKLTELIGNSGK